MKHLVLLLLLVTTTVKAPKARIEHQAYLTDYEVAMWSLKQYEGLHYTPYWDYKQYTIGWGTKSFKNDRLQLKEANERARMEYQRRFNKVSKRYPKLTRFQKLVITNFKYNTPIGNNLDKALIEGDINKAAHWMRKYVYAGGHKLKGLVKRRRDEAWLMTASPSQRTAYGHRAKLKVIKHIKKANLLFTHNKNKWNIKTAKTQRSPKNK